MTLNLTLASLVNAAGAFLFLLVGLAILALARRRGMLIGTVITLFGITHVVENLLVPDSPAAAWTVAASPLALLAAQLALVVHLARPLPSSDRRRVALFALANATTIILMAVGFARDPSIIARASEAHDGIRIEPHLGLAAALGSLAASWSGFYVLAATSALRARRATLPGERRALLLFALSIGLFATFVTVVIHFGYAQPRISNDPVHLAGAMGQIAMAPVLALFLIPARTDPHLFRRAFFAVLGVGVVGCAIALGSAANFLTSNYGAFGIVRTIGAALLVLAIVKYDLLGVPLPRLAVRRGPLAAGALATLFIVAQVAQNFLSAQYGLILGGIVAGAFLFAAQPIQRAIEARTQAPAPAPGSDDDRARRRRELYATAVRAALADHSLTREEERALAHLAEELGIGAGEAHDIRIAAEASLG